MSTQEGIATAGRCFLFGLFITSPATPLHIQPTPLSLPGRL
jgi:hypothetical protein